MRTALLKKPLLSLFAYEVSCRVRVEKTTLVLSQRETNNIHPKNLVPPLLSWIRLFIQALCDIRHYAHAQLTFI